MHLPAATIRTQVMLPLRFADVFGTNARMRLCTDVLTICQGMSRLHSLGKPARADACVPRPERVWLH